MNSKQQRWLNDIAGLIPQLLEPLKHGHNRVESVLGVRVINGKHVRLSLVAEVVDPGRNPLHSHASVNMPQQSGDVPEDMAKPMPRNRKRAKRW